jgi:aspartyl-tRNA(Asn)/glutamyl-tRNA(Gln) amidotransferase subunit B
VPLMELVTKPVIHDAKTAVTFAKELQLLLRYLGAGEANMEKGEMRVEANISVAPIAAKGDAPQKLGTKTEVKNLNSFKSVEKAIAYEIERQNSLLKDSKPVLQETRGWDDVKGETYSQRSKESSHDYRYYPDPDIPKMKLSEIGGLSIQELNKSLPELPWNKRARYQSECGMTDKEVAVFIESPPLAEYFDKIISAFMPDRKRVKLTVNYLLSDYLGALKTSKSEFDLKTAISPASFAELVTMVSEGLISSRGAKDLIGLLIKSPTSRAKELALANGLIQKSDAADLVPIIQKVLASNAKVASEFKAGKTALLQFLIGQTMKATKGAGNPEVVKKLLLEQLSR